MANNALLVVNTSTFFTELFRVAKHLKADGKINPVIILYEYPTRIKDIKLCREASIDFLVKDGDLLKKDNTESQNSKLQTIVERSKSSQIALFAEFLKRTIKRLILYKEYVDFKKVLQERTFVKQVLNTCRPDILILAGDMVGYDTFIYVKEGHKLSTPSIIIPSTMSNGLEQAEVYYYNPYYWCRGILGFVVEKMYPKWIREHKDRKLIREPFGRLLAIEIFGFAPPLPWIFNSGYADVITVESKAMFKYYEDCGLPIQQMKITGSPADDILFYNKARKNDLLRELYEKMNFSEVKPLMVTALPPDSLYMQGGRPDCEFDKYAEIIKTWVTTLSSASDYNIVICLHPSVNFESFAYLEEYGVKIARMGTAELLPLCDLFVASVSTTIRWAIACGIPVINYDVYQYHYTDFQNVKGVLTVYNKNDFFEAVKSFSYTSKTYSKYKQLQEIESLEWGQLDGKAKDRILSLIESVMRNKRFN